MKNAVLAKSWRCYVCDSTPLKPLVSYCTSVLEFVQNLQDKGNVKAAAVKQKRQGLAKSNSSDSGASTSDVSLSVFSGSNLTEAVKLVKSATEPLHELITEIEEELEKDSQLADSSRPRPQYDVLASKLQTQYTKSLDALLAVKQTKLQADVKNCSDSSSLPIISLERLDNFATEQTDVSGTRHVTGDGAVDTDSESTKAEDVSSSQMNNSSRASRADIEAQRDLHKQMLSSKDESSESDGNSSESSTSSSEDAEASSTEDSDDDDDEYDPKKEIQQVKLERGHERRTTMKKQKMKAGN